jgi:hypothetical protein
MKLVTRGTAEPRLPKAGEWWENHRRGGSPIKSEQLRTPSDWPLADGRRSCSCLCIAAAKEPGTSPEALAGSPVGPTAIRNETIQNATYVSKCYYSELLICR